MCQLSWELTKFSNISKTELTILTTNQIIFECINFSNDSSSINISDTLKRLGVTLSAKLSFVSHMTSVLRSCNYHSCAISHIRPFFTTDLARILPRCSVISTLDCCNFMLYNIAQREQTRIQRIINKAAKVAPNINTLDHCLHHSSKSYLAQLHWLPMQSKIIPDIALLSLKSLSASTLTFLCNLTQQKTKHQNTSGFNWLTPQATIY